MMKKYWELILVIILSLGTIAPLFHGGFFSMHDDTQPARVFEMVQALKTGQFPVRWVPDLGYGNGYPLFNFYSPLPYYLGAIFMLLGFDALISTKIMFGFGILMSGIFMYFLAKEFWGKTGGLISALFFMYAPYHTVQIYIRGSVGEFWALGFIPLLVLSLFKIISGQKGKWIIYGGISYALIILSHNLTAMMVTLFLIPIGVIILIRDIKRRNLLITYHLSFIAYLGLGLSAFYWLPAILEMSFTNVSGQIGLTANFRDHFVCLFQLWDSLWGFGGSSPGCIADGLSFKIGKIHLVIGLISLISLIWFRKDKKTKVVILLSTLYFLLSAFMLLEISRPVWEAMPFMAYLQYPWRFLSLVIFFISILSGGIFLIIKNKFLRHFTFYILLFILLFYNLKYFQPQTFLNIDNDYYTSQEALTGRISKISDEYLPKDKMVYNFRENTFGRSFANLISGISLIILFGGLINVRKAKS